MGASRRAGKSLGANVPGTIAWFGMPAVAVSAKLVSLRSRSICRTMSAFSFWWSLVQVMVANPSISSPPNPFTLPNKPGRLSLPMPDVGRLKCPSALPSPKWPLNLRAFSPGKPASNSCSSLPLLMLSCFPSCPTRTSYSNCSLPSATELESGAERPRLHFIVYAWQFLASGSPSALTLSLP